MNTHSASESPYARDGRSASSFHQKGPTSEGEQQAVEILESIGDGFYALDREDRLTYVNARTEQLWGRTRDQLIGRCLWDLFPTATSTEAYALHRRAAEERRPMEYATFSPVVGRWFEVILYPSASGLTVYFRDITARKENERAGLEAVQVRDEVLRAVSHDLKNPLSAIKGHAQILERWALRRDLPESELLVRGLRQIDAAAMRMSAWIEELVDVTRLELGEQLALNVASTDLVKLVQQAVADHQETTNRHNLLVEVPDESVVGAYDPVRLRRVLDNLLGNAIKYSPQGGTVAVAVSREADADGTWAVVTVHDEGVGIPEADRPKIFKRFHRAGNVEGRIRGTGLGLAGSLAIVEQHGGTITAESQEGSGSTFTVRLALPAESHRLVRIA